MIHFYETQISNIMIVIIIDITNNNNTKLFELLIVRIPFFPVGDPIDLKFIPK